MLKAGSRWWISVLAGFLAVQPMGAQAQVTGEVEDLTGQPVVGANVELWGDSMRYAGTLTDSLGRFSLAAEPRADRVVAFGLGTDTASLWLKNLAAPVDVEIVLKPRPLQLPSLGVVASSIGCPERDDPRARALWDSVAASYIAIPDTDAWGARVVELRMGVTAPGNFGSVAPMSLTWAEVGGGMPESLSASLRDQWPLSDQWIRRHGYAQSIQWGSLDGREDAWHYLALDGTGANHLLTPVFAALQRFGFDGPPGRAPTLLFCSKNSHEPGIHGRIFLNAEDRVVRLEWRFVTPAPHEDAGGEANFSPDARYLLPTSGEFWRKTAIGHYFQEAQRYGPWFVGSMKARNAFFRQQRAEQAGGEAPRQRRDQTSPAGEAHSR